MKYRIYKILKTAYKFDKVSSKVYPRDYFYFLVKNGYLRATFSAKSNSFVSEYYVLSDKGSEYVTKHRFRVLTFVITSSIALAALIASIVLSQPQQTMKSESSKGAYQTDQYHDG